MKVNQNAPRSSLVAFLERFVNLIASPVSAEEVQTSAIFGASSPVSFAKLDPSGYFAKTCQGYAQLTLGGSLQEYCETWPRWGIVLDGVAMELPMWERRTEGNEYSLWATPNTMDMLPQRSEDALIRQATTTRKGRTKPANLREQVDERTMRLWPTPTVNGNYNRAGASPTSGDGLDTAVKMWPTPRSSDAEHGGPNQRDSKGKPALPSAAARMWPTPKTPTGGGQVERMTKGGGIRKLEDAISKTVGYNTGQLNPAWVELLMNFPPGWTDLDGPLALEKNSTNGSRPA